MPDRQSPLHVPHTAPHLRQHVRRRRCMKQPPAVHLERRRARSVALRRACGQRRSERNARVTSARAQHRRLLHNKAQQRECAAQRCRPVRLRGCVWGREREFGW
eukprot:203950-Chlamydomonas_euryale.AAC.3